MGEIVGAGLLAHAPTIMFDQQQGTFMGGASDFGEDYGLAW